VATVRHRRLCHWIAVWQLDPDFRESLGKPDINPATYLSVPKKTVIEQYLGPDAGNSGYRFDLGGGVKLAVVLWQDITHVTETGDVAPGLPGFTAHIADVEDHE